MIKGGVCIATPFDMVQCCVGLDQPFHTRVYDKRITRRLAREMEKNAHVFRHPGSDVNGVDIDWALQADRLKELDERLTRRTFGYSSVWEYYRDASCGKRLGEIDCLTLFISAIDDPISRGIPFDAFRENPSIALVATESGGHIGWNSRLFGYDSTWVERVALDFLSVSCRLSPLESGEGVPDSDTGGRNIGELRAE